MTKVNIAEFKAHLGQYLDTVRRGETVVIADRGTPIAKVAPYAERERFRLETIKPRKPPEELGKLSFPPLPGIDSLAVLLEDREDRT